MAIHIPFDNSYARLRGPFHDRVLPTPVSAPHLIAVNRALAYELAIDADSLTTADGLAVLAGNSVPVGAEPIATAYAGHQFGNFTPQLGDGRAILLGEVVDRSGARRDIQLKGSGPTVFSRRGDGRAALGPVLREYIISEAMAALGIPTTRALAAVTTGDRVQRETALPGAILTRVAASHIRVGTFQFLAARGDVEALRQLADHVIARHYPDAAGASNPYRALIDGVIARQADLVARWMLVGFIHGVMNTDNSAVSGETIDYGPCAFMDAYDPATVFSSIDRQGRYAYQNQPGITHWNLVRLAESLLPLLDADQQTSIAQANAALGAFPDYYETAFLAGMRSKLGLMTALPNDLALVQNLLDCMAANSADFTLTFRHLSDALDGDATPARDQFIDPQAFDRWAEAWRVRLTEEPQHDAGRAGAMRRVNPLFIPRNHRVEAAIEAAVTRQDFAPFEALMQVLSRPFDDQPKLRAFAEPPPADQRVFQTFCGT
ncbi:YdiU family protein [Beijerinckia sp. L45]|uniref:protein adenylyltransferase SelO n=1 Tax=Beijerinckia sp. L45 TaxID=1641855 RepID=UPI00131AEFBF|nr:YdiU family protein [Beijerinckia sp. L45]